MSETMFSVPVQGRETDERYTPAWVFEGLGLTFDTDPASPGEGHGDCVPALRKITRAEDGLAQEWTGSVWLNPPFSKSSVWARKWIAHGQGVFLGPVASSMWTIEVMRAAELVWFMRDFAFTHPLHAGKRSSMPLFMASMGVPESAGLKRLAISGRHEGVLFGALT